MYDTKITNIKKHFKDQISGLVTSAIVCQIMHISPRNEMVRISLTNNIGIRLCLKSE